MAHVERESLECRLRAEGFLEEGAGRCSRRWLVNLDRHEVRVETVLAILDDAQLAPGDFAVLDGLDELVDPDGRSYFLLPPDVEARTARAATLMTYVLNAGTGYGRGRCDFAPTPYSAQEITRILHRQAANSWSYRLGAGFVRGGGRLVTTPSGVLMGLGGGRLHGLFSQGGGTAWGDLFLLNIDSPRDAAATEVLRAMIRGGTVYYESADGRIGPGKLDLDRLLHHEERHSQQWARLGRFRFVVRYVAEALTPGPHRFEVDAGWSDGGYR